jgi:DNA-binding MarR family transcriptional regulator
MSQKKKTEAEILEFYDNLYKDEVKFSIITALEWYGSLNNRQISKLVGKPEPTTYRHIKQLFDDGLIVSDTGKFSSKGKFYNLTPVMRKISDQAFQEFEESENIVIGDGSELRTMLEAGKFSEFRKSNLIRLAKLLETGSRALIMKRLNSLTNNVQETIINNFALHEEKLKHAARNNKLEEFMENEKMITNMSHAIFLIRTGKTDHLIKLNEVKTNFVRQLSKIKREFERDIEKEKISENECLTQYLSLFGGYIDSKFIEDE